MKLTNISQVKKTPGFCLADKNENEFIPFDVQPCFFLICQNLSTSGIPIIYLFPD